MMQFCLPLKDDVKRPVARIDSFYGIDALLDTGAVYPVWVQDEEILADIGGEVVLEQVEFGGYGGTKKGSHDSPF